MLMHQRQHACTNNTLTQGLPFAQIVHQSEVHYQHNQAAQMSKINQCMALPSVSDIMFPTEFDWLPKEQDDSEVDGKANGSLNEGCQWKPVDLVGSRRLVCMKESGCSHLPRFA